MKNEIMKLCKQLQKNLQNSIKINKLSTAKTVTFNQQKNPKLNNPFNKQLNPQLTTRTKIQQNSLKKYAILSLLLMNFQTIQNAKSTNDLHNPSMDSRMQQQMQPQMQEFRPIDPFQSVQDIYDQPTEYTIEKSREQCDYAYEAQKATDKQMLDLMKQDNQIKSFDSIGIEYTYRYLDFLRRAPERYNCTAKSLVLKGGGSRGIFTASVASYIEDTTQDNIMNLMHFASGTSTGGLLAILLSMQEENNYQYSANNCVDLYIDYSSTIFKEKSFFENPFGLFSAKYSSKSLYGTVLSYAGNKTLIDIPQDISITYFNLTNPKISFFKSSKAKMNPDKNFYLKDCAMATASAPTYFDPYELRSVNQQLNGDPNYILAMDGGTFENNPISSTLAENVLLYPNADAYFILNIGTGKYTEAIKPRSLLSWAINLPNILIDNATDHSAYIFNAFIAQFRKPVFSYTIDLNIPKELSKLDTTDPRSLTALRDLGRSQEVIQQINPIIDQIARTPVATRKISRDFEEMMKI